jgi:hypothetical protein
MCPDTCNVIRADNAAEVQFLGGCVGAYTPAVVIEEYQADCSMFPSGGPLWEFLTYDTDSPGDSEVIFEMRTGNTYAEASAAPWVEVARSSSAAPDATFGAMTQIDLTDLMKLGPLAQQEFMHLRITVNPTSNQQATATLYDWDLQVSCYSNE